MDFSDDSWTQIDEGANEMTPPAGAQYMIFRVYGLTGKDSLYIDDAVLSGEPNGNSSYPGATGIVKDASGNPVAGAVVFLKSSAKAQEFATSSAVTDSQGKYTVCVANDGAYYAVAWKAGYNLSTETQLNLAAGALTAFNPTMNKGTGGRDLAISTAARVTAVKVTPGVCWWRSYLPAQHRAAFAELKASQLKSSVTWNPPVQFCGEGLTLDTKGRWVELQNLREYLLREKVNSIDELLGKSENWVRSAARSRPVYVL